MSDIRRYTVTTQQINEAKKKPNSITTFFSLLRWDGMDNETIIPKELQKISRLQTLEKWLFVTQKHSLFMIISPIVAYMYAQQEAPSIVWLLVLLAIPIFCVGAFGVYAFKTGWFAKKLDILKHGFVVLVGNDLIENLPQHRFLLFEERRLERLRTQVQEKIKHVRDVHEKLIQKSIELNEDSHQLSISMQQEQEQLQKVYQETGALLSKIRDNLTRFEKQRSIILNRAELEYIRNQARTLSQEEQAQFSQRALADLEVDSLFLTQSIGHVEHELGRIGVDFEIENEFSR